MDAAVFRRGCAGGDFASFPPDELRDSHAKGLVNDRVGGGGGATGAWFFAAEALDDPWRRELWDDVESLEDNGGGVPELSSWLNGWFSVDSSSLLLLARFTSSRDVVDSLCAVKSGDFWSFCLRGVSSASDCFSTPASSVSSADSCSS